MMSLLQRTANILRFLEAFSGSLAWFFCWLCPDKSRQSCMAWKGMTVGTAILQTLFFKKPASWAEADRNLTQPLPYLPSQPTAITNKA